MSYVIIFLEGNRKIFKKNMETNYHSNIKVKNIHKNIMTIISQALQELQAINNFVNETIWIMFIIKLILLVFRTNHCSTDINIRKASKDDAPTIHKLTSVSKLFCPLWIIIQNGFHIFILKCFCWLRVISSMNVKPGQCTIAVKFQEI